VWREFLQLVDSFEKLHLISTRLNSMPAGLPTALDKTHWVVYRNNSDESAPPFALLRITGVEVVHGQTIFVATKPDTTFDRYYAVNGGAAVSPGKMGECTFTPQCITRVESGTPSVGDSYGAKSGQWGLELGRPGFTILGVRENSRDLNIADVLQQPVSLLTGKTDSTITAGGSGTVSIHFQTSGTASEYDVTAVLKWMHNSQDITSTKEVLLAWLEGQWVIIGAQCEV